ncbi:MAG: DNA-processing protein DprA [Candidatus Dormibacteria bacterium]
MSPWLRFGQDGDRVVPRSEYPRALAGIPDAPDCLWVRGSLELPGWHVAVVGSRNATEYGLGVAEHLGFELGRLGVVVVSGLARGVDGAAHRGALAAGGATIAVLGSGLDRVYPREHAGLAAQVAVAGAVVSEFEPAARPLPGRFPQRNRIITGLSLALVVVEATERSGAMVSVRHAQAQGREVRAVPGSILSPASRGVNLLLRDGAPPLLDPEDALEGLELLATEFGQAPAPSAAKRDWPPRAGAPNDTQQPTALGDRVLGLLGDHPASADRLAQRLQVPAAQVAAILSRLELEGLVRGRGLEGYVLARRRPILFGK